MGHKINYIVILQILYIGKEEYYGYSSWFKKKWKLFEAC